MAADWLGISWRTVAARIDVGELAAERDGRRWLVSIDSLKAYRAARSRAG